MSLMMWTRMGSSLSARGDRARRQGGARHRRIRRHRCRVRARVRRRGRPSRRALPPRRGTGARGGRHARRCAGPPGRPDRRARGRPALRGGALRARAHRRVRRRRRCLALARCPRLGAAARTLGEHPAPEPDLVVPDRAWLPARGGADRAWLARARRLDRRPRGRGRARGLRGGQVRDPRRPAPEPEERGRAGRAACARERRRAGMDRDTDDTRARRPGDRAQGHADDGPAQDRECGRRRATGGHPRLR